MGDKNKGQIHPVSDEPHSPSAEPSALPDPAVPGPGIPVRSKAARRLKKRHFAGAVLTGLGGFIAALALGMVLLIGRDLQAPDWLQERIEHRLAEALPELDIKLGQIALRIERSDLSPRVFIQNITVRDDFGLPFASLSELSVRASFIAALKGQFLPRKISLSGALVKLRRKQDGSFDLTIGSALRAAGEGASLTALVEGLDTLLVQPELSYLRQVQADSLTVLYEDARAGRAWTVDGGRMRMTRSGNALSIGADFALLGGQDYATTLEVSYDSEIGSPAARIGMLLADAPAQDIASQTPALLWLEALRAPISGALRTTVDASGALGPLNATLQIGAGVVQPEDEARPIPFEAAQVYFSYDPTAQELAFSELTVKSAWVEARAEGRARLLGPPGGWPEALLAQLKLSDLRANPNLLYPEPITVQHADLDMRINFDPFRIDLGQMVLREAGQSIVAEGRADITAQGWRVALDARAPVLDRAQVLRVWPDSVKPKTRAWVAKNVLDGSLSDARLAYRSAPQSAAKLHLDFDFSQAAMRVMKSMPPVEAASGYVRLQDSELLAVVETGQMRAPQGGLVRLDGTHFKIPDMRIKEPPAQIHLDAASTVTGALSLLDQKPFEFITKAGQPVTLADGRLALAGAIAIKLKKQLPLSEIDFDLRGTVSGARSTSLLEGRVLAADQLALRAQTDAITLEGAGRIDTLPFSGRWRMPLGTPGAGSQLTGAVELSDRFVETFKIGVPPGSVRGTGQGQITIDLKPETAPEFALSSDLAGLALRFDPLGWQLGAATRGALSVRGALGTKSGAPPRVERLVLEAPGLSASGELRITADGTLERAVFDRLRVGDWLDAQVSLIGRGRGATPAVSLSGGTLDLRRLPPQGGGAAAGGNSAALPLDVTLDRLQVTKEIALTQFRGAFISNAGLMGDFTARLNDKPLIKGRTKSQAGRTAVQITADDAGAVISAAGLLKGAGEGKMTLDLTPGTAAGSYDGRLEVANLRLRDAPPALALLSVASGIGLLEQMDGGGLLFTEVNSSFRIAPRLITVINASAVGPSIGLSVDGFYNVANKTIDMQGVVSPFFAINGIGSILTRKGEGLIGFNYTLDGPAAQPRVRVNPLSLFTPGMFREIFRRPPPQLSP